jgi:putative redox protein
MSETQMDDTQLNDEAHFLKARVKWIDNLQFIGESGSGHAAVMDGPTKLQGTNLGMRPMEMILVGFGGCTAVDVLRLLRGLQEQVTDCDIEIDGHRAGMAPNVFKRIHLRYIVTGRGLDPTKVRLAIKLSKENYCSASAMLGRTAEITYDVEIREAD